MTAAAESKNPSMVKRVGGRVQKSIHEKHEVIPATPATPAFPKRGHPDGQTHHSPRTTIRYRRACCRTEDLLAFPSADMCFSVKTLISLRLSNTLKYPILQLEALGGRGRAIRNHGSREVGCGP